MYIIIVKVEKIIYINYIEDLKGSNVFKYIVK